MLKLRVNGETREVPDTDPATPLLWVLRDRLGLTGTRYGCGKGLCGSCTVQLDGQAVRSCLLPAAAAVDKEVVTIEGLQGAVAEALRQAWREEQVPQCGYCQSGQLMSAEAVLRRDPDADAETRRGAMSGNLCRCGTYPRIERALARAAHSLGAEKEAGE